MKTGHFLEGSFAASYRRPLQQSAAKAIYPSDRILFCRLHLDTIQVKLKHLTQPSKCPLRIHLGPFATRSLISFVRSMIRTSLARMSSTSSSGVRRSMTSPDLGFFKSRFKEMILPASSRLIVSV